VYPLNIVRSACSKWNHILYVVQNVFRVHQKIAEQMDSTPTAYATKPS
jgi:hypothetical protein